MEGSFRGFFRDAFGRHRMAIQRGGEDAFLKVPKHLRKLLQHTLRPGTPVVASGFIEFDHKAGCDRSVVYRLGLAGSSECLSCPIRVCTRKQCWNNGGRELWHHLKSRLAADGLTGTVKLKAVDCFGDCERGPNVEFAGTEHHHCTPRTAARILEPLLTA